MSALIKMQKWQRMFLLFSTTLLLSIAVYAQGETPNEDASRSKKPSLETKLRVLTPAVCAGSPLKLRLEVTNVGQEAVRLNSAYFWNNYSVYATVPEVEVKDKEYFLTHIWPRSTSEDILLLAPGKMYIAHTYWSLDVEDPKLGPGNYTLEIGTYGTRNKVQFELHDCGQKELRSKNEHEW